MKISIVTPVFNSAKTVSKTVESILAQNYGTFEHIIVDNLSKDGTVDLVRAAYRAAGQEQKLRVISEKDAGISDAFNKGIRAATGEIVTILNSDDSYAATDTLSRVAEAFRDPEVKLVHGNLNFLDDVHGSNLRRPLQCPVTQAMPINHPTMFVKSSLYETCGLYPLDYRYAMDFEWVCRLYGSPEKPKDKWVYLNGAPLTNMAAGGASHVHELKSIDEVEKALRAHGFWNQHAENSLRRRRFRIRAKSTLSKLGLNAVIRMWRNWKWSSA